MNLFQDFVNVYNKLYRLKTFADEEIQEFYQEIKTKLLEAKNGSPDQILLSISYAVSFNLRYYKQYKAFFKMIYDEYHPSWFNLSIPYFLWCDLTDEHGFSLSEKYRNAIERQSKFEYSFEFLEESTIYRAILNDDIESFISFTERDDFNPNKRIKTNLYPMHWFDLSYLELCCYHGSVNCFKFFTTKFNYELTNVCLEYSFLGRNPDIMSECLKHLKPTYACMDYSIVAHNIDFVSFLMNEYRVMLQISQSASIFCLF